MAVLSYTFVLLTQGECHSVIADKYVSSGRSTQELEFGTDRNTHRVELTESFHDVRHVTQTARF